MSPLECRAGVDPWLRAPADARHELQRAAEQALQYGIDLAHQNDQWAANGGAIVALDPHDGAVLALASAPTFKPSVFVGRSTPKKLEALCFRPRQPALRPRDGWAVPARIHLEAGTALAGMQEHVFSPYDSIQCTGSATYGLDKQRFRNRNPFVNRPMTLPEALAESCDTYFYEIGNRFYEGGTESRVRMQKWARSSASVNRPGSTSAARPTASCRHPSGASGRSRATGTAPGTPATRSSSRSARRISSSRRCRWPPSTRWSQMAAARQAVSRLRRRAAGREGVAARRAAALRRRSAELRGRRPRGAPRRAGRPVLRDALGERHVLGRLRQLPGADLGEDGHGREGRAASRLSAGHLEDQSWWCGWGPSDSARLVVCALIENGGHGSSAAAPAALKVFERFFNVEAPQATLVDTD